MTLRFCTAAAGLPRSCAAPAGGALSRGRGRLGASLALCLLPALVDAGTLSVPSGRDVISIEYLADEDGQGNVLRARYHVPGLTGSEDIDGIFADMIHLCEADALSIRQDMVPQPPRIIVSLSAVPLAFGETDGDVVQYFEAYRVENDRCIWELF